jgi:hypothetical protein
VNSTVIYSKNLCKCHNVSPVQQYDNKINKYLTNRQKGYRNGSFKEEKVSLKDSKAS